VIRTLNNLSTELANALAWRKKELSTLYLSLSRSRPHEASALRRASVPILYAHWEGFAKQAATLYLEFVARRNLTYRQLTTNFVAIACRQTLKEMAASDRTDIHSQLVEFLLFNQDERARIPFSTIVDTKSNLNSATLKNIAITIGIPYSSNWTTKEPLIDGGLLKLRNDIAHGKKVEVDPESFEQLYRLIMDGLLDQFKDTIENAATLEIYLR
jgi:hypothetical protein